MPTYPNDQGLAGGAIPVRMGSDIPVGATSLVATSGNVANAAAVATLAAVAGKTNYVSGVQFVSAGATAASVVQATIAGLIGPTTATYPYAAVAGATLMGPVLNLKFDPPIPANAANLAIVATLPALGAGNTAASTTIYGYRL